MQTMDSDLKPNPSYSLENNNFVWMLLAILFGGLGLLFWAIPVQESASQTLATLVIILLLASATFLIIWVWKSISTPHSIELTENNQLLFKSIRQIDAYPISSLERIVRHRIRQRSWQTSSRGKSTNRVLIFKFVQGNDVFWQRFPILSYQNEKLEEFVKEIEERHTVNTDQFWSWQTFD